MSVRDGFRMLRSAGVLRLTLIYYATIVPAFPLTVLLLARIAGTPAAGLFTVWSRGAVALALAPLCLFVPFWALIAVALYVARRRSAAA